MEEPPNPWLFRLTLERTPSPYDPKGAGEFYQALGTMMVAWGRLEGHFLTCIITILATEATKSLSRKIPMTWQERARIWKDAFRLSPALKPHEPTALAFLEEIQDVAQDRHAIAHSLWERFNPGPPLSAGIILINHKKGTPDGIDFQRATITTDELNQIAQKASRLNIELQVFSAILIAERGPAPSGVHRL
jgi:hypothetical protein